jgi:hypothetical protein
MPMPNAACRTGAADEDGIWLRLSARVGKNVYGAYLPSQTYGD